MRRHTPKHNAQTIRMHGVLLGFFVAITWAIDANNVQGQQERLLQRFTGRVVDRDSGQTLAARIYLKGADDQWWFVSVEDKRGSALPYQEQWVPMPNSVEQHTTISAHPFSIDLPAGEYELTVVRGKEFVPHRETIRITDQPVNRTIELVRMANLEERGWYSGETHVHRRIRELPNVQLAEDLNLSFPVTFWTTRSDVAPHLEPSELRRQGPSPWGPRQDVGSDPIQIDETHWIVPRNTEYEVFSVGQQRHVLGAMFLLNHKEPFEDLAPPVGPIAKKAHLEGALIDLDKHSWPWSMMLVPIANVDLYELSNNSVWRTNFGFRQSAVAPADYMRVERDDSGMTEQGWLQFGFENYYALLNCGFQLKPTAGTASGVHPVPLGFSRVYVHIHGPFTVESWIDGLRRGRSFVTTGPLLDVRVDGKHADERISMNLDEKNSVKVNGVIESVDRVSLVEFLVNGQVRRRLQADDLEPLNESNSDAFQRILFEQTLSVEQSSWVAVRVFTQNNEGRMRFAHTAPWYLDVPGSQLLPRLEQIDYLVQRMEHEVERNRKVLEPAALQEFEEALKIYRQIKARVEAQD